MGAFRSDQDRPEVAMPLIIPEKRALLLHLKDPARVASVLPRKQLLGPHELAVPHRTAEFLTLKNLGVRVDGFEPIRTHYNFPLIRGMLAPMPHQIVTATFMTTNTRGYILNQQRTGKTAAAIWATDFLMNDRAVNKTLIVCTMSNMRKVWADGIFDIVPNRTVGVLHGSRADRRYMLTQDFDYFVINHDGIKVIGPELIEQVQSGRINAVVVDELTEFAEHTTQLWAALDPIAQMAQWCWGMTATPMSRDADKVYGQARLINRDKMPEGFGAWQARTMLGYQIQVQNKNPNAKRRTVNVTKWTPRADAADLVYDVLQPVVRFAKKDVLKDLPPITHELLDVGLTAEQRKVINSLRRQGGAIIDASVLTVANAGVLANKILQVCGGAIYDDQRQAVHIDVAPKIDEMMRLIRNTEQKVVIFATYQSVIDLIVTVLKKRDIGVTWVDGRVTGRRRDRAIDDFYHDKKIKAIVAHPETTAHGLEFSMADTTIWWTLTRSSEHFQQANERMASAAQKNPMGIYYLIGSAIEEAIYNGHVSGENIQQKLFSLIKQFVQQGV